MPTRRHRHGGEARVFADVGDHSEHSCIPLVRGGQPLTKERVGDVGPADVERLCKYSRGELAGLTSERGDERNDPVGPVSDVRSGEGAEPAWAELHTENPAAAGQDVTEPVCHDAVNESDRHRVAESRVRAALDRRMHRRVRNHLRNEGTALTKIPRDRPVVLDPCRQRIGWLEALPAYDGVRQLRAQNPNGTRRGCRIRPSAHGPSLMRMTDMTNPVHFMPSGYTSLTPFLCVDGAAAAIDFYTSVFGAEVVTRNDLPDGKVAHSELQFDSGRLQLSDPDPAHHLLAPSGEDDVHHSTVIYVLDVDAVHGKAWKRAPRATRSQRRL